MISRGSNVVASGMTATNALAEWASLNLALAWIATHAQEMAATDITIVSSAKLVIDQLNGRSECRAANIRPIMLACKAMLRGLAHSHWEAIWVSRRENDEANALAWAALRANDWRAS